MGLGTFLSQGFNDASQWAGDAGNLAKRGIGDAVGAAEKVPVLGAAIHDTGHVLTNLAQWDRDGYADAISRPLATLGLVGVNMNNWGDAFKGSTWAHSWGESQWTSPGQALTANVDETLGGWSGINSATKNMNEQQVQKYYQNVFENPQAISSVFEHGSATAKIMSGTYDAGVSWNSDPTVLLGAGAGALRNAAHATTGIKTSADAERALQHPAAQKIMSATDNMTAYQAKKLPFIAKSANPDLLASVFNQTVDRGIRENAYKYIISNGFDDASKQALQDTANAATKAQKGLQPFVKGWGSTSDQAGSIMESIANAQVQFNPQVILSHLEGNGNWNTLSQALHAASDDAEKKLALPGTQQRLVQDILGMKGHITWLPGHLDVPISSMRAAFQGADKFGDASKLAQHLPGGSTLPGRWVSQVIYKGMYQTPLKVLRAFGDAWPDGWLDFTSNKGGDALESFLARARGMDPATRQGFMNQYYEAGSNVSKKQTVAQLAEHAAAKSTLLAHGASDEDAEAILAGTYQQRTQRLAFTSQRAAKRPMSQAFSAATDADGNPVDLTKQLYDQDGVRVHGLDDEDGTPIHVPILETMKRQGTPLLDLDKLDSWAGQNLGKFQTLRRAGGSAADIMTNSADLFNSIWKNGVLLRFGFTPRVMTDMGLRSVATLGAARTFGLTKEAAANVAHNVGVTGYDFVNRMLKNRLFAPDTLKTLNDTAGVLTSVRDDARVQYMNATAQKAMDDQAVAAGLPSMAGTPSDANIASLRQRYEQFEDQLAASKKAATPLQKTRFGDGALKYKGVSLTDIFGGENAQWLGDQVSSHNMIGKTFQRNADMEQGVSGSGAWDTVRADSQNELEAASHPKAWRHAINNQIMGDTLGSQIVRNNWNEQDVLRWLRTPNGRSYLQNIPGNFKGDLPDYASRVVAHVHYTVPAEVRQELVKTGAAGVSLKKLDQLVPSVGDRPDVNGQLLNLNMGRTGGITNALQQFQSATHKWLGSMPLDTFIYHPTAAGFYRAHLQDAIDKYISFNGLDDAKSLAMKPELQQSLEKQAFSQAKNDVWSIMYDLSKKSTAAHQLRFVFPFLNAQQEIIKHWFNIALDHPAILAREQQIWNSPAKAGLVYDTTTGDPADKNTPLENQAIRFQIPHIISSIPGLGSLADMGQMQISKESINPILMGQHWYVPGAGPMVQVGVQALSKLNPGLQDNNALKLIMPYGPGDSLTGAIMPTWAQRLETGFSVNNPQYATTFAKVYQAETVRYNEGLRTSAPTVQEIQSRTQSLLLLQALSSAVMPFSAKFNPGTQTGGVQKPRASVTSGQETSSVPDLTKVPVQGLIDQYKKLESVDPANAATDFYNQYGQALFALTMSTTKSNAAVPATAAGLAAIQNPDIRAMLQQDPSIAYAVVGPTAAQGPFDMAAYEAEMNTQIGGGNTNTFRQTLSPQDMVKENNAQLGWQQFDQLTSILNAKMAERGLTSMNQTSALDLRTIKDQFLTNMNDPTSQDYNPDWYDQYTGAQTNWNSRIQSLTDLVSDPNIVNNPGRTDLKVLGQYLEGRQEINQYLTARPNKEGQPTTLADKANADLASSWDAFVSQLVMSNTNFALIYQHLLAGDPVNSNLKSNALFQQSLSGVVGQ
jgi:hypothetical protein